MYQLLNSLSTWLPVSAVRLFENLVLAESVQPWLMRGKLKLQIMFVHGILDQRSSGISTMWSAHEPLVAEQRSTLMLLFNEPS